MIIRASNRIKGVKQYYFARKLTEIKVLENSGQHIINLGIGSPDLAPAPEVLDELQRSSLESESNKYQSYRGLTALREAFANWYDRKFDVSVDAETEVLPLIGSKEGIIHISMTFLNEGDEVLIPNPGYPTYATATKLAGGKTRLYDLNAENNWLPDLKALADQDLTSVKIMWLNYPNVPTGAGASKAFFEELVAFAHKHAILLCHDNPYSFILKDKGLSLLSIPRSKEVALELNSLSKSFNMAGWRVGALLGAETYLNEVMKFKSNMDSGMYKGIQLAAIKALELDDTWYIKQNNIYTKRRKVVWKIMDALACEYDKETSGLFVWGKLPDNISNSEVFVDELLEATGIFITPGFIFGSNGEDYVRIALCSPLDTLEEALNLITNWKKNL